MHYCDHAFNVIHLSLTCHIFNFIVTVEQILTKLDMKQATTSSTKLVFSDQFIYKDDH